MSDIVNRIKYAMSLRNPQEEALTYLDAISSSCNYLVDDKTAVEAVASANCENHRTIRCDLTSLLSAMQWQQV